MKWLKLIQANVPFIFGSGQSESLINFRVNIYNKKIAQSTKFYVKKYMLDQCSKLKVSPSEALTMMALEQLCSAWPHKITENPNATHN